MKYLTNTCPACGESLEFSEHEIGREWNCPHCKFGVVLQPPPEVRLSPRSPVAKLTSDESAPGKVHQRDRDEVPGLLTLFIALFLSAVYCFAFVSLMAWLNMAGLCLFIGAASGAFAYKVTQWQWGFSKTVSGWIAALVGVATMCFGWYWYWELSPLSEAKRTCQELRELYRQGDHTKAFAVIKSLSEDPPRWLVDAGD
jgi:hypothetical protein